MACFFVYQLNTLNKSLPSLISHGIDAACYHSQSDNEYILDDFSNGRLRCLVNVNILTTGSNFPIADMCVLIRATESTALYVQIVGRVMRLYPNKTRRAFT